MLRDPDLRKQQAQRFDAVFVDEYQDVSALQEAILNALKRGEDGGQSYFYVGDVKQSIYRFRLAEPGLFLGKLERFSPQADAPCRRVVLNLNFRSRTGVLDAVNRVFAHVMDRRVTEIDYDADARLYPARRLRATRRPSCMCSTRRANCRRTWCWPKPSSSRTTSWRRWASRSPMRRVSPARPFTTATSPFCCPLAKTWPTRWSWC